MIVGMILKAISEFKVMEFSYSYDSRNVKIYMKGRNVWSVGYELKDFRLECFYFCVLYFLAVLHRNRRNVTA